MIPQDEDHAQRQYRIKTSLKRIDAGLPLTEWEAGFVKSCLSIAGGRYLSERQVPCAERLLKKYEGKF